MATANYYRLFALPPTATPLEIKRRYRQLSLLYHPDRGGSVDKMVQLNEAYRVLSNSLLRKEYDRRHFAARQAAAPVYADVARPQPTQSSTPQPHAMRQPYTASRTKHSRHSYFWVWLLGAAILAFGFLAYQLYSVTQTSIFDLPPPAYPSIYDVPNDQINSSDYFNDTPRSTTRHIRPDSTISY